MNLPFFIARRSLLRQKGAFSSFIIRLAILATALSVAVMVLAIAFITGFKYEIREKIFSFWGHVLITPYEVNASNIIAPIPIKYDSHLITEIRKLPHVKQVIPWAARPAILQANGMMEGIKLKGVTGEYQLPSRIGLEGRLINYADTGYSKEILLSRTTADRLKIKAGESLQLYFLEPGATAPRIRRVVLAGIFHTGMDEIDKEYGLCDLRLLQRINNWGPDQINGYQADLEGAQYADTTASVIFYSLLDAPLSSYTMKDLYINIFDWLKLQDINAQIVLAIMALVAVINLSVTLLILMVEQARTIGLLKSLGMGKWEMQQLFLCYAGLIAGAGVLLGNIAGVGICFLQQKTGFLKLSEATYYMSQVPVRINWYYIAIMDVATLLICVVCMWLPSLYIRRIQPAKVLQFK